MKPAAKGIFVFILSAGFIALICFSDHRRFTVPAEFFLKIILLYVLTKLFVKKVVRNKSLKDRYRNVLLVMYTLTGFLLLLEIIFMGIPVSNATGSSKASWVWFDFFWHPVNELGYRDKPVTTDGSKLHVLVVGDSFTAGHGIRFTSDRFTDQLQQRLGDSYRIYNLGKNGSDTKDEYQSLLAYPVKPDAIILQYFGNDIEGAAGKIKSAAKLYTAYEELHGWSRWIILHSYLLNFIYWNLSPKENHYREFLAAYYADPVTLSNHLHDLEQVIAYAHTNSIPLVVLIIPFLNVSPDLSDFYVQPVSRFLSQHQVEVANAGDWLGAVPMNDRVVNKTDGHASVRVNGIMADHLAEMIGKLRLKK